MKTSDPRELLLRRHRDAEPRLNALRAAVLAEMPSPAPKLASPAGWRIAWRELFWPARAAWVGLGILGLCAFSLDRWVAHSEPARPTHGDLGLRTRAAAEAVVQIQRRENAQLAQWMEEAHFAPPPAQPPASRLPAETPPPAATRRQRSSLTSAIWVA